MISKELCYVQAMRNETSLEYEEQEEEAPRLSFCDLISRDDASTDRDLVNSDESNYMTSRSNEEDESFIFDFFSSGFSFTAPPPPAYPPDNILFCRKQLIPNKISYGDGESTTSKKQNNKLKASNFKKKVINWMTPSSSIFSRTKTMFGSSSNSKQRKNHGTSRIRSKGPDQISNSSPKKTTSRGRWWMLMFGSMRVPNEMEMADIKTRQERRPLEAKKEFVAMFKDHEQQRNKLGMEMRTGRRSSSNGLIGVVRSFSCKAYFSAGGQTLK